MPGSPSSRFYFRLGTGVHHGYTGRRHAGYRRRHAALSSVGRNGWDHMARIRKERARFKFNVAIQVWPQASSLQDRQHHQWQLFTVRTPS